MNCRHCGAANTVDSNFCIMCRSPLAAEKTWIETAAVIEPKTIPWKRHKGKLIFSGAGVVLIVLIAIFFKQLMGFAYYNLSKTASSESAITYAQKAIDYDARANYKTYISSLYLSKANNLVDSDSAAAIEMYDKAGVYGMTDAISEGLAKAYLNRAKKSLDSDVNKAIQYATLSLKSKSNDDNKKFLGEAYVKKADGLSLDKPDEAIQVLRDAKPYVAEEALKPIINKAGQQIVKNANKDMKVVKLLVQDLDGDQIDEMVAIVQQDEYQYLTAQVFKYEKDAFTQIDSLKLDNNLLISAELQALIKDKPSKLVIRSTRNDTDGVNDEVAVYELNASQLNSLGTFYINHGAILQTKDTNSDGNLDFVSSMTRNDTQKHVIENTYNWKGSKFEEQSTPVVKYADGGKFNYPDSPENAARSFLEALALGADSEVTQMTYNGDRSGLSYGNLDLSRSYTISKTNSFNITAVNDKTSTYGRGGNDKILQIDYELDSYSHSIYLLLAQDGGQWKVYALS